MGWYFEFDTLTSLLIGNLGGLAVVNMYYYIYNELDKKRLWPTFVVYYHQHIK